MSTGELPFKGANTVSILRALCEQQPVHYRQLNPDIPVPLADLIMQLLAKAPAERPSSARLVAESISALAAGKRVMPSAPLPVPGRTRVVALVAVTVALLIGGSGYLFAPTVVNIATNKGRLVIKSDDPHIEVRVLQGGDLVTIVDAKTGREVTLKAGAYQLELSDKEKGLRLNTTQFTLTRGERVVVEAVFAATPSERPVSGAASPSVKESEVGEIRHLSHPDGIAGIAFSRDGRLVVSGGGGEFFVQGKEKPGFDFAIRLWDVSTGRELRRFEGHRDEVYAVAFSSDGRRALSGSDDSTVRLWEVDTGKQVLRLEKHQDGVLSVAMSPDNRRALSSSRDTTLRLWDLETGEELRQFRGHKKPCWKVLFSRDGRQVFSTSDDDTTRIWDVETGKELKRWKTASNTIALDRDGQRLLSGGSDGLLQLWDVATAQELRRFDGHKDWVRGVAISPDGRRILSGSSDKTVRLWDIDTGRELWCFEGHTHDVWDVAFSPDGTLALSCSSDKTIRLWRLPK